MSSSSYGPGRSAPSGGQLGGDVVVTGVGMRTAVGNDAVQTCATIRTAISRFAEWPHMGIGIEEAGVVVAALDPEIGDWTWAEKWFEMAKQPVHEALWQAKLFDGKQWRQRFGDAAKLGAWLALPAPGRPGFEEEEGMEQEFAKAVPPVCVDPATADVVEQIGMDNVAGFVAVSRAVQALVEGRVKVAVVIGVDSHLSSPWLDSLDELGALKTEMRNIGFIPGEAAGVIVLERMADAKKRGAEPLLTLGHIAVDREEVPIGPEHPIRAEGMSRVVRRCLQTRADGKDVRRIIVDLNGERWRALEWALTETRCLGKVPHGWKLWHPADSYGDVGAASGVLALGMAARAYERGYGGPGSMLLASATRSGDRAAAVVWPGKAKN